ncbi:coiled-coil domain-containing protein [Cohnella zeiphila]|uniref:SbsC C-terminal domain-containing protein n=1 Tax=Cohnella zeiphila TaxID=2761120 RepID=A0A7X0SGR9_9BACL|nr:hypothetical protein [Cohnella zeiphila]MBB6729672.1 hypothetical protein [Cohnella zeiphila]
MKRRWAGCCAAVMLLLAMNRAGALLPPTYAEEAEPMTDETRQLLEKGLSLVEIDREIDRISGLRDTAGKQIKETSNRLSQQEIAIAAKRERAGRVLRSYYMGQKDAMWASLLSSRSLPDLLRTWEQMDLIFTADRRSMNEYETDYKKLKAGYDTLQKNERDLAGIESQLKAQRDRIVALQKEVEQALSASDDADHLRQMMDEMQTYWQNVGLYVVRDHFDALAKAMNKLPEWIQQNPDMLKTSGLKTTLTITDDQLNEFLRGQDDRLKQFTISFHPGKLSLEGSDGGIQVGIEGHYTVEEKPENAILFHIDKLVFNGLELPDTTRADLERQFDLGFYPQQLIKFVKADSVSLEDGRLTVVLRFGK